MSIHRTLAPAKINLGLFLGPTRSSDSRHELVTVMQSISLADEVTLQPAPPDGDGDRVVCPGVPGAPEENLAATALRLFRERTGWSDPPVLVSIVKRIPVAAGLGGGSADAAATLRLAAHVSGLGDPELLHELARELGADVPAQLEPGRWLASGAGERLEPLPPPRASFAVLVLAIDEGLSTAAVYREADRLSLSRSLEELEERRVELLEAFAHGAPLPAYAPEGARAPQGADAAVLADAVVLGAEAGVLHNDLQRASVSLCPPIAEVLGQARVAGARPALVSGSGPTVLGLFADPGAAGAAAARLAHLRPAPVCAAPVGESFARVVTL
jgi:4-diphosphocytidyl-2-C-methyl-D-erythritol kinase